MKLFSYKMTHDTGFAPNPFHGHLSLATCMPYIRETKQVGHFVAGFTSKHLCEERVGEERLVYIMRVTETTSFAKYYFDERFQCKKPTNHSFITRTGDNIYKPISAATFDQEMNYFHDKVDAFEDLKSHQILLSTEFFYFGSGAIPVNQFGIALPKYQTKYGILTHNARQVEALWSYLKHNFQNDILIHQPHTWKDGIPFNT
jgi:Nucleotide modification associated domain 2